MCEVCDKLHKQLITVLGTKNLDFGVLGDENKFILELIPYNDADSKFSVILSAGIGKYNFPYINHKIYYCPFCGEKF